MAKLTESRAVLQARATFDQVTASPVYRTYLRFIVQRGTRLAAAMTYTAFLSLFPLLALSVAITSAALGESGVQTLRTKLQTNLPGLASKFPLDAMVSQATTVELISGVVLLWASLSWVNTARGSLRAIWKVPDMPGRFVTRKLADLASLIGLGLTAIISVAATAASASLATTVLRWLGLAETWQSRDVLRVIGLGVGLAASTAMFAYLLAGIPRLIIAQGLLLRAAFAAAVALEFTKGLVASYLSEVASKSLYGVFGVPVAIMIFLNLTFQMLLFLSAWTATRTEDVLQRGARIGIRGSGTGLKDGQTPG